MNTENNSNKAAKNSSGPRTESLKTSELNAAPSVTPAPRLPQHPVDRYVVEYWSVLSRSVAKTVATYYANATAAEVWPDDDFYKNAPPFVDSWLCEGWAQGRVLGWLNVIPDSTENLVYWSEADALQKLISDLQCRADWAREEAERTESAITKTRAALALARVNVPERETENNNAGVARSFPIEKDLDL